MVGKGSARRMQCGPMAFRVLMSAEVTQAIRKSLAKRTGVRQAGRLGCLRNGINLLMTRVKDGQDKRDKDKEAAQEEKREGGHMRKMRCG